MSLFLRFAFVILLGASIAGCPQEPVVSGNFDVNVQTTGQGQVTASGDLTGVPAGTALTLNAVPATNWRFSRWDGDVAGNSTQLQITVMADLAITAVFEEADTVPPDIDGDLTVAAIYGTNVLELSDGTLWEISLGFVGGWRVGDPVVLDGVRLTNTYDGTISVAARGDVTYRGTVSQVQAAGEILVLDDDSQWRIHVADRAMVALWSTGQAVVMGQTDVVSFHVVRTSDGQIAAAAPAN
jgi:hypothetical protein